MNETGTRDRMITSGSRGEEKGTASGGGPWESFRHSRRAGGRGAEVAGCLGGPGKGPPSLREGGWADGADDGGLVSQGYKGELRELMRRLESKKGDGGKIRSEGSGSRGRRRRKGVPQAGPLDDADMDALGSGSGRRMVRNSRARRLSKGSGELALVRRGKGREGRSRRISNPDRLVGIWAKR
jgi:hypothetical protein